jgi:hypothetical protein
MSDGKNKKFDVSQIGDFVEGLMDIPFVGIFAGCFIMPFFLVFYRLPYILFIGGIVLLFWGSGIGLFGGSRPGNPILILLGLLAMILGVGVFVLYNHE